MALNAIPGIGSISTSVSNAPIPAPSQNNVGTLAPLAGPLASAQQVAATAQAATTQNSQTFTMAYSHDIPKYGFVIALATFTGYSGFGGVGSTSIVDLINNNVSNIKTNFNGTIVLPLPAGGDMIDRQDLDYSQHKFGPGWGTAAPMAASFVQQVLAGQTPTIPDGSAGQAAAAGGATLLNNDFGKLGLATVGMAVNQFQTVLFDGPTYKRYTFSFRIAPHNAQESQQIRDIIVRLRMAAAPALGAFGVFWNFPEIVQCAYIPQLDNVKETYMYAFKPAVLTSVAVNYAPNGEVGAFYRGGTGAPESVIISLSFLELEYWTRQNYQ